MPGGDRTGPRGMGPGTGRMAGFCAGYDMPGYANPVPGRGFGAGFGRGGGFGGGGRGWRNRFFATGFPGWLHPGYTQPWWTPDPDEEKQVLKNRADTLQSELDSIKKRLEKIEEGTRE